MSEGYRTSVSHQDRRQSQQLRNPRWTENRTPTNTQAGGVVLFSRCLALNHSGKLQKEREKRAKGKSERKVACGDPSMHVGRKDGTEMRTFNLI